MSRERDNAIDRLIFGLSSLHNSVYGENLQELLAQDNIYEIAQVVSGYMTQKQMALAAGLNVGDRGAVSEYLSQTRKRPYIERAFRAAFTRYSIEAAQGHKTQEIKKQAEISLNYNDPDQLISADKLIKFAELAEPVQHQEVGLINWCLALEQCIYN